jgi:hypothetical protein
LALLCHQPSCASGRFVVQHESQKKPKVPGTFPGHKLFEAFQSLEDQVFRLDARGSAAAYKHSTAHVLRALGVIAAAETHPDCQERRGEDESARMEETLRRPRRVAEKLGIPWGS